MYPQSDLSPRKPTPLRHAGFLLLTPRPADDVSPSVVGGPSQPLRYAFARSRRRLRPLRATAEPTDYADKGSVDLREGFVRLRRGSLRHVFYRFLYGKIERVASAPCGIHGGWRLIPCPGISGCDGGVWGGEVVRPQPFGFRSLRGPPDIGGRPAFKIFCASFPAVRRALSGTMWGASTVPPA